MTPTQPTPEEQVDYEDLQAELDRLQEELNEREFLTLDVEKRNDRLTDALAFEAQRGSKSAQEALQFEKTVAHDATLAASPCKGAEREAGPRKVSGYLADPDKPQPWDVDGPT